MSTAKQLSIELINTNLGYKSFEQRKSLELVFAFVEPIGGGAKQGVEALKRALESPTYNYSVNEISLRQLLESEASIMNLDNPKIHPKLARLGSQLSSEAKRINLLQQLGNTVRERKGFDRLAKIAINKIAQFRQENNGFEQADGAVPVPKPIRVAHIIRSLKNPEEYKLLKALYGNLFFLIGVSGNYEQQVKNFGPSWMTNDDIKRIEKEYDTLAEIDQYEGKEIKNGQQVRKIFYKSDLFLRCDNSMADKINSFLRLLFCMEIKSPTIDERMMFEAYSASLRSTCLSRQVGAAIADESGELISVGWNDIPSFGGGLATDVEPDSICAKALCKFKGECRSSVEINVLLTRLTERLKQEKQLLKKASHEKVCQVLREAGVSELIEFSRAIHAEMESLLSAARTGKLGLKGGTIYVTTYPCENCVKHIIASGIKRVVYIEPYPKSRAEAFFSDFIVDEDQHADMTGKLIFSKFAGIAPQSYQRLYKMSYERKDNTTGRCITRPQNPEPNTGVFLDSYTLYEGQIAVEVAHEQD